MIATSETPFLVETILTWSGGELVHVAVTGKEKHVVALILAAARKRAQYVIALPALAFAHGHVERAEKVLHQWGNCS